MLHVQNRIVRIAACIVSAMLGCTAVARAQTVEDWVVFVDDATQTECGVVTASNVELVVLFDTGRMQIVSGPDVILDDLLVDNTFAVTFEGQPAGFIEFSEDREGLPTVFWVSLAGTVVGVDTFTGEPFDSNRDPSSFVDTFCDACVLIDSHPLCDNGGGDGDDGDGDGLDGPLIPLLCGTGAGAAALVSFTAMPLLRRRRISRASGASPRSRIADPSR